MARIKDCKVIDLPIANTLTGSITVLDMNVNFNLFDVKRVFYIFDIPAGMERGAHAHKEAHQLIIAPFGSFEVLLYDGHEEKRVMLNKPFQGLYVPPGIWAAEQEFSGGAICLVCTSHVYEPEDYIRNMAEFEDYVANGNTLNS